MKLSDINKENFSDEDIQKIVYSNIEDSQKKVQYAIVFGNSMLIKERVNTAVEAYKAERIKKMIFTGGVNGISNQDKNSIAEAIRMKDLAIKLGVKEEDILIETESNNSFENIDNVFKILSNDINIVAIITSEFHLKRCMAIIKKKFPDIEVVMIPSRDGYSDADNWFLSDSSWNSGRSLATYEAGLLIKYAKNKQIEDLEIEGLEEKYTK